MAILVFYWLIIMTLFMSIKCITFTNQFSSYAVFERWTAIENGYLHFQFKTHRSSCLLIYLDDSNSPTSRGKSYLQLSIVKGTMELVVQSNRETSYEKLGVDLNDLEWHSVQFKRFATFLSIALDDQERALPMTQKQIENFNIDSYIFLGAMPRKFVDSVTNKNSLLLPRFVGCINNLRCSSKTGMDIYPNIQWSQSVQSGCLDACEKETCSRGGQCVNWFNSVSCDCLGTGYEGVNCSTKSQAVYFNGMTSLRWRTKQPIKDTGVNFELAFKPKSLNGVLFTTSQSNTALTIELVSGSLKVTVSDMIADVSMSVDGFTAEYNKWHSFRLLCRRGYLKILVDHRFIENRTISCQLLETTSFASEVVYFGGRPGVYKLPSSLSKQNFTGCLQQIQLAKVNVIYKLLRTKSATYKVFGSLRRRCPVYPKHPITVTIPSTTAISTSSVSSTHPTTTQLHNTIPDATTKSKGGGGIEVNNVNLGDMRKRLKEHPKVSSDVIAWITTGTVVGVVIAMVISACAINYCRYHRNQRNINRPFITATFRAPHTNNVVQNGAIKPGEPCLLKTQKTMQLHVTSPLLNKYSDCNGTTHTQDNHIRAKAL